MTDEPSRMARKVRGLYILDDTGTPVECDDPLKWAAWLQEDAHVILKQETVDGFWVSTVFLGMDTNAFREKGKPIVFETMAREATAPRRIVKMERATTKADALRNHEEIRAWLRTQ